MITAVDTNILLDVLIPDAPKSEGSEAALLQALRSGAIVIGETVYAELAAHFLDREDLERFLGDTGIRLEPSTPEALHLAGQTWREYLRRRPSSLVCPQCGSPQEVQCVRCGANLQPRQHLLADFLIGAHALVLTDRLLTRDRGYYSTYFPRLALG
ncbi:MAG: nucleotide-binding protein [Dehalococcoidia bacterium]|nr:nucleotide-binding protein [Dehalococcoidia bacterium]